MDLNFSLPLVGAFFRRELCTLGRLSLGCISAPLDPSISTPLYSSISAPLGSSISTPGSFWFVSFQELVESVIEPVSSMVRSPSRPHVTWTGSHVVGSGSHVVWAGSHAHWTSHWSHSLWPIHWTHSLW